MPIITKKLTIKLTDNHSLPDIDFDLLKPKSTDMRKKANGFKDLINDFENGSLCKLPLSGYMISSNDESSESYYPHSDWQGSTGESWIGK